jgi:hypothetical protein
MENIGGGMAALSKSAVGPDLARLSTGIKNSQKSMCSHIIFLFSLNLDEIAGGDGVNQFLLKI